MANKPELEKQNRELKDKIRELEKALDNSNNQLKVLNDPSIVDKPKKGFFFHKNDKGEALRINISYNIDTNQIKIDSQKSYGKDIYMILYKAKKDIVEYIMGIIK